MKIIHTADWHLGQYFKEKDRKEEHLAFLEWLLDLLSTEQPDALIVAGDVFDSTNPPQYAFTCYYEFLSQAQKRCPNIIITGGNHDSRHVLDAPRELLQYLSIKVVGGGAQIDDFDAIAQQIIEIKNQNGDVIGAVAAVPFLREGDVRPSIAAAETHKDKVLRLREGIKAYYRQCLDAMQHYAEQGLPLIATGHLYAAGSQLSDDEAEGRSERRIHATMGNQEAIDIDVFPAGFQYVALGHIHRPQIVGKQTHIRYSGSPIPLSFSELNDYKQVLVVSFEGNTLASIRSVEVPTYRRLLRISGTIEQVIAQIAALDAPKDDKRTIWAEIKVLVAARNHEVEQQITQSLAQKNMIALPLVRYELIHTDQNVANTNNQLAQLNLYDLNQEPDKVFLHRCRQFDESSTNTLQQTFNELLESIER